jgi:hypothetical protein
MPTVATSAAEHVGHAGVAQELACVKKPPLLREPHPRCRAPHFGFLQGDVTQYNMHNSRYVRTFSQDIDGKMKYKLDYCLQGSHGRTKHERIVFLLLFVTSSKIRLDFKCDKTTVS